MKFLSPIPNICTHVHKYMYTYVLHFISILYIPQHPVYKAYGKYPPLVNTPILFPCIHGTPCTAVSCEPADPPNPLTGLSHIVDCE